MKKVIYATILPLILVSGLVFANRESKKENSKKLVPKPLSASEKKAALKKWEATPEGIFFNNWKASPEGKQVLAGAEKIRTPINDFTNMEAVVTSLSLPPGSKLGFGIMVKIGDEDYILSFGAKKSNEFQQLHSLKINDRIILKGHAVSYAPKYSYPIIKGEYVERQGVIIFKAPPQVGGC